MSCFGCCGDEDTQRAPDNRNQYPGSHPARNDAYRTADPTPKGPQPVKVQPIAVPTIPMDEIREVTKGFGDEALIGEGSFGRVYFGTLRNGRGAAIKKLDSSKQPDQELLAQVKMLLSCLVTVLMGTPVSLLMTGRKGVKGAQPGPVLSWIQRVKIAVGAAKGLEYLHEKAQPHVIHRDIKSSNVLLFDDDVAKIADFDLSNQAPDMAARLHSTRVLGTFGYHAPE
ncbi:unnamed protein product [Triticum turgidum subsp. durum]|uniref:Protein kinase domain-containing protein n=1 Tax=Triticum turgidum subsp. durum TaxID=4567 RepID=A0A9R0QM31_TRITD|nr:unnamed protein product [Triticum turgidum subsp. durum]